MHTNQTNFLQRWRVILTLFDVENYAELKLK